MTSAVLSPCGRYRYELERDLDLERGHGVCLFVMLNPSTADATANDPTITRCIGFATREGFGRLSVGNLFALRSTDPGALAKAADPIGRENDAHLLMLASRANGIVCAWGAHPFAKARAAAVRELLGFRPLYHLGLTAAGFPRHPLYLPSATRPRRWL